MADHLLDLIAGACSSPVPDLSLNYEICDLINKKQGTFPRVAAMSIVRYVNSKNKNQAMVALSLLDQCVKKCGYPFHLQISSKEFLNALVYMFPAKNRQSKTIEWAHFDSIQSHYSDADPVIDRILYMLKEWKVTLVDRASYRDDFVNINSMYRLLRQRGYRFPEMRESSIAALTSSSVLYSPEELEEQDHVRLSARLQEHIRQGTKEDLKLADAIMKILTGYGQHGGPDYNKRFTEQIRGIRSKAIVLFELLQSMHPGEAIDRSMRELHDVCLQAQEKVHVLLERQYSEHEDKLLALSTLLNDVLSKYADVEKGIFDSEYDIHTARPTAQPINNNLIDLDDTPQSPSDTDKSSSPQPSVYQPKDTSPSYKQILSGRENPTFLMHDKNGLKIHLEIYERVSSLYKLRFFFSNDSTAPMEEVFFQMATPKSMEIKMGALSSTLIGPKSVRSVFQWVAVNNPGQEPLRLRYKVTYDQLGVKMEQTGEYRADYAEHLALS
ncbi:hypothetical protein BX666DRAFT_1947206 [Dichotomocladium elegans]|nr:hypothetical protein BX666DRAFT_1947206 [Dichotomocladium elegans]